MNRFDVQVAINGTELVWVTDIYTDSAENAAVLAIDEILDDGHDSVVYVGHNHFVIDREQNAWVRA